ncbi:hypothetical protein HK098_002859 [Nowakowskiella sp. JEL0407]|nr:hypothetical protein HK098_002859 [Nowakowskiella sp. JEL0407]
MEGVSCTTPVQIFIERMPDDNDRNPPLIRLPSRKDSKNAKKTSSSDTDNPLGPPPSADDKVPTRKQKSILSNVKTHVKKIFIDGPTSSASSPRVSFREGLSPFTTRANPAKEIRLAQSGVTETASNEDAANLADDGPKILSTETTKREPESLIEDSAPMDEKIPTALISSSSSSVKPAEAKSEPIQKESVPVSNPVQSSTQIVKEAGDQSKAKLKYGPKVSPYLNPKISAAAVVMRKNKETNELELLLTQRWINPQKGFWELPGDFIGHQDPSKDILRILNHQTNLDGSHAETICVRGDPTRDERDHNVTFFFFIRLPETEHQVNLTRVLKMEQDGTVITVDTQYSKIDRRITPSWAWWYPVSQLPNWLTDQERLALNKPLDDAYELVKVAFDHQLVFPFIKERLHEFEKHISVIESPKQPLNRGNSALTTDIIVVRQRKDQVFEIALIERGQDPFKGKKAFPGGFVNYREDPPHGAVRELKEETFLTGSPSNTYFLGYKGSAERDPRQHTVTCAYVLKADPNSLSKLMGGDDAATAKWYKLNDAFEWAKTKSNFAFDHSEILLDFKAWWETTGEKDGWYVKEI